MCVPISSVASPDGTEYFFSSGTLNLDEKGAYPQDGSEPTSTVRGHGEP